MRQRPVCEDQRSDQLRGPRRQLCCSAGRQVQRDHTGSGVGGCNPRPAGDTIAASSARRAGVQGSLAVRVQGGMNASAGAPASCTCACVLATCPVVVFDRTLFARCVAGSPPLPHLSASVCLAPCSTPRPVLVCGGRVADCNQADNASARARTHARTHARAGVCVRDSGSAAADSIGV